MFGKIFRAQPSYSGLWPEWPITAQPPLILAVNETLPLDGGTNVGVGNRCPGKVVESHSTEYTNENIYLFYRTVLPCWLRRGFLINVSAPNADLH